MKRMLFCAVAIGSAVNGQLQIICGKCSFCAASGHQ